MPFEFSDWIFNTLKIQHPQYLEIEQVLNRLFENLERSLTPNVQRLIKNDFDLLKKLCEDNTKYIQTLFDTEDQYNQVIEIVQLEKNRLAEITANQIDELFHPSFGDEARI